MDNMDFARRFFGTGSERGIDVLKREAYDSDEQFLDAVAFFDQQRATPEFKAARKEAAREFQQRQEKAERERQRQEYQSILAGTTLDSFTESQIRSRAQEQAAADLKGGRIGPKQLADTVREYETTLTERAKSEKAASVQMNAAFRQARGHTGSVPSASEGGAGRSAFNDMIRRAK